MDTHQPLHCQDEQDVKVSHPSKSPRLTDIIYFITAATFIIAGIMICILNIVKIIYGPWSSIINVLFAGIGLIVAFYVLFIQHIRREE